MPHSVQQRTTESHGIVGMTNQVATVRLNTTDHCRS